MNEGAIEAVSNSTDFAELNLTTYRQQHNDKVKQIQQLYANEPGKLKEELEKENLAYQNRVTALEHERIRMGNSDYMLNIGILTLNNMNMFSKLYRRGFQHSLREFNVLGNAKNGYRPGSTW